MRWRCKLAANTKVFFLKAVKLHFNTDVFDSLLETAGISGSAVFDISNML